MSRLTLLSIVLALIGFISPVVSSAQSTAPISNTTAVYLATIGPGEAGYEKFGHTMIWLIDRRTHEGVSCNWGIFDFNQPNFYGRFVMGRMLYRMAAFPVDAEYAGYLAADRTIRLQELNFTPTQTAALKDFLSWNLRSENVNYRYDYFYDNCSTRPRDALDRALGGQIAAQTKDVVAADGHTLRYHVRKCTAKTPWLYVALDYCLGRPIDRPLTVWQEMFSPMQLADQLRNISVRDEFDGVILLVKSDRIVHLSNRYKSATAPPTVWPMYLASGATISALIVSLGIFARRSKLARLGFALLVTLWSILAASGGWLMTWAWFTDHAAAKFNENILLLSPLSIGLVFLVPLSICKPARFGNAARRIAIVCFGLSLLALPIKLLPPWPAQSNWGLILLAMPINAAIAFALCWATRSATDSSVSS